MTKQTLARRRGRSQQTDAARTPQVFGYARVSTKQQAEEGVSLAEQERQIRGRAAMSGWELTRLFVEPGVSGGKALADRPAGKELIAALRPDDIIIAAKLDRTFRDAADAHNTVKAFREMGVHLYLLDCGSDDCSGNGVAALLIGVLSSVAQWERNRIGERITEAKTQARIQQRFMGGAKQFGFEKQPDENGKLVPIPEEQASIAMMKAMKAAKHPLREIAEAVRARGCEVSYETVRRVLLRETADTEDAA